MGWNGCTDARIFNGLRFTLTDAERNIVLEVTGRVVPLQSILDSFGDSEEFASAKSNCQDVAHALRISTEDSICLFISRNGAQSLLFVPPSRDLVASVITSDELTETQMDALMTVGKKILPRRIAYSKLKAKLGRQSAKLKGFQPPDAARR